MGWSETSQLTSLGELIPRSRELRAFTGTRRSVVFASEVMLSWTT